MRSKIRKKTGFFENREVGKKSEKSENDCSDRVPIGCRWLTTEEAADYLRIHPGTLRNMVSNGTVKPSGKIGRLNRFLESDLRKLLLAKG